MTVGFGTKFVRLVQGTFRDITVERQTAADSWVPCLMSERNITRYGKT